MDSLMNETIGECSTLQDATKFVIEIKWLPS